MNHASLYRGPPPTTIAKWMRLVGVRLKVRMSYPADLLVGVMGDLLLAGIGVAFLAALFHRIPDIRGWTWAEVLLTWGLAEVCCGLFFILFQGLWVFNQRYVLRGELDRVLLRPLHPLGQVLVDNLKLEGLAAVGIGVCMVAVALSELPSLRPVQWLALPLVVVGGVGVLGGVCTGVSSLGLLVHHRGTAVGLVYQGAAFARYPLDVFPGALQRLLLFICPFGWIAAVPASWLAGRQAAPALAASQPLVGLLVLAVGVGVWQAALGRYRSPGN